MDNNVELNTKLQKFLFIFPLETLANRCCCGCSLKTGVEIIAILALIDSFAQLVQPSYSIFLITFIRLISFVIVSVGSIFLFLSSNSSNLSMAYKGYFLYAIKFYIDIFMMLISVLLFFYDIYYVHYYLLSRAILELLAYLIIISFAIAFKLYLIWIVFSYVRYFAKGDINTIENNTEGYIRIQNNNQQNM